MGKRFITLSLNPAIDRTMYFDRFVPGTLNRTCGTTVRCAGSKGMNAARAILAVGGEVVSVAFSGGETGEFMRREMEREGIPSRFVDTACGVRENIKLIESDGRGTEANDRGGPVSEKELYSMTELLLSLSYTDSVVLISGSLPVGATADTYKNLIELLRERGATAVLDCDGEALRRGLLARPALIKPNRRELCGLLGVELPDVDSAVRAARRAALEFGCDVLATLGEDGSVYAARDGRTTVASAPAGVPVRGFAGAGDTYLGVFCHSLFALGEETGAAMIRAASAAAAKVASCGTTLPGGEELTRYTDRIKIKNYTV